MADRYQKWTSGRTGGFVATRLGLPRPEPLRRYREGGPALPGPVVLGGPAGRLLKGLTTSLGALDYVVCPANPPLPVGALVFDATGITDPSQLTALYEFFHPRIRSVAPCGRVLILSTPPESAATTSEAVAQRAIEGFMRSVGKELRRGATANVLQVEVGAEEAVESAVRFVLSPRSAYVSGQVLKIGPRTSQSLSTATDASRTLARATCVVTGAARGIGAEIARVLARDGAFVYCLDVPSQGAQLREIAGSVGGESLELDICAPNAAEELAQRLKEADRPGIDVFVHNAGITRDKTLGKMERAQWNAVLGVNLIAVESLTHRLIDPTDPLLRPGGRIICTSSIGAIAGNVGQTNYAASKAGLIGLVSALAPDMAARFDGTINAVAPGFIETQMTASVPLVIREAARRMNSLRQGGLPVDVAEAVAFLAAPESRGINGQVLRVCGQALLGA